MKNAISHPLTFISKVLVRPLKCYLLLCLCLVRTIGGSADPVLLGFRDSFWLGFCWLLLSHSGKTTPLCRITFPWCSLGSRWSLKILLAMWPHIIEWGCGVCWKEHRHWYQEDLSVNPGSCLLSFVTLGKSPNSLILTVHICKDGR